MSNNSTNFSDSDNNNLVTIFETKNFWSFITFCYCVVFLVGIVGNLWSICSIIGSFVQNCGGDGVRCRFLLLKSDRGKIFKNVGYKKPASKNSLLAKRNNQNQMSKNLLLYNLALNLSDLCVLSNVFLLLTESYLERWPYGVGLCKFYWTLENANKIVSKFILTAMSLDRFVSLFWMKKPQRLTSLTGASSMIIGIIIFTLISLIPVIMSVDLITVNLLKLADYDTVTFKDDEESLIQSSTLIPIQKCLVNMEADFEYYYTIYLFTVGFCIPSLITVLCYLFVLIKLYYHTLSSVICRLPLKRVTLTTLALVLLYLICWTPYWTGIVYLITKNESELTVNAIYAVQLTHILVYLNSALNWIPYTLYCRRYNNNNTGHSRAAIRNSPRINCHFQLNLATTKGPSSSSSPPNFVQKLSKKRSEKSFIISQMKKTNV